MRITKSQLKQIIAEELENMVESSELDEGILDRRLAALKGWGSKAKGSLASFALKQTGRKQAAKDVKKSQNRLSDNKKISHIMKVKHKELASLYTEMSRDLSLLEVDQAEDVKAALTHLEDAMKGFKEIAQALENEIKALASKRAPQEDADDVDLPDPEEA
tara:strand:- start:41 stop:523 length:483 start_codon:yes stop_codon:yes gene_type:complete